MANSIVRLPAGYFPDPDTSRPLFFAKIYIGEPDLDPKIPANQKTVTGRREDGVEVTLAQPVRTNRGGVPVDGTDGTGNVVTLLVDGAYSMTVDDRKDAQKYNFANVLDGAPVTFDVFGDTLADYTNIDFKTVADAKAGLLPDGSTINLAIGYKVTTRGYHTENDGGGGEYIVVAGGTGTDDGGAYHNMTNGNQLQLIVDKTINAKVFGCKGVNTDDTSQIDAMFNWLELNPSSDGTNINGSRGIMLTVDGPSLYFPAGEYVYNGSGYTPVVNKSIVIKGDGPASSMINISSDTHLINPNDTSPVISYIELNGMKFNGGRGAFYNQKTNLGNVAQGKRVFNCAFLGYTSCAFGSEQGSDARWFVQSSWFDAGSGAATGTPVGLFLPDEVAEVSISGCEFAGNKYSIITANSGISEFNIGPNNAFFNLTGRDREADIWFLAGPTTTQGRGIKVSYNRFSNENLDASNPTFLIADRDEATDAHVFNHLTTVSDNFFTEIEISHNSVAGNDNPSTGLDHIGFIYSYAYRIGGLRWNNNRITQWRPYIVQFDSSVTVENVDFGGGMNSIIQLNHQSTIGNTYTPPRASNIDGAAFSYYEDKAHHGDPSGLTGYTDGTTDLKVATFTSNTRTASTGPNVTQSNIPDATGGVTGSEFRYAADEVVNMRIDYSALVSGKVLWFEVDVKKAASQSLDQIQLEINLQNRTTSRTINLTDNWERIRIPIIFASGGLNGSNFFIQFAPRLFLDVGTKDTFAVGRKAIYHSSGYVDYSLVEV